MRRYFLFATSLLLFFNLTKLQAQTYTWYRDADGDGWGNPGVSSSSASKPDGYVQNNLDCNDAVANSSMWSIVGTAGISSYTASYTAIAVDASGTPYVGINDNGNGATVYKYTGSAWSMVGAQNFMGQPQYSSMILDGSGNPYFAAQNNSSSQAPTVMKFAAGSWSMLGGSSPTSNGSIYNSVAADASGNVYYAYKELYSTYSNKLTVAKYNGSSWSFAGSRGFSTGTADYSSIAVNASGTPYIAFSDGNSSNKLTVMSYNGSSWSVVGSAGFSAGSVSYVSLAIDGSGTPYVAYSDNGSSDKLTVKKYNGSSWTTVGSAGFSAGTATNVTIKIDNSGTPYVAYTDGGNSNKATVMKYNGSSWAALISAGFTSGSASYLSFTLDSKGTPYIAYQDGATSNRLTVMKLSAAVNPATTPVITASPTFSCYTGPVTLTVQSGTLNDATDWKWYSGSCGGAYLGSGTTITTSVTATTTFYARGENLCASSAGACGFASTTLKSSPTWYQDSDGDGWGNPSVAYANCGQPAGYVANHMDCNDASSTGTQWYTLGSGPAAYSQCQYTAIAIDADNDPYVGFYDNYTKGTVTKFTGGSWATYGSANFTASSTQHNSLAFDADGTTLYMAYQDGYNGTSVMKNAGNGWTTVGTTNFSAGQATYQSIAVAPSGNPYVAYVDNYWMYSNKASVMRYNGTAWEVVGSYGFSPGTVSYMSLAIDGGGTPYVAFADGNSSNKVTVMKYDGASWAIVGSAGFSAGGATYVKLSLDRYGVPYVVYSDGANGNKATVMKFNGTSWATVGSSGFSSGSVSYTAMALDAGGNPYVVFSDGANGNKATVMKHNGSNWVVYGSAGISTGSASYTNIAIDNAGLPVITFQNSDGGSPNNTPVAMKAGPVATAPATPTVSATLSTVACGSTTVLTASGSLNGAGNWYWYSGSCGGTYVGSGGSVTVTPTGNTTYYARGWGGCLTTPGSCGNTTIAVTAGTPSVPSIAGSAPTCIGSVRTLSNSLSGGTWSSSNTSVATVGSSGTVTAVGTGNATITYSWGGACGSGSATVPVTINASPGYNAITGTASVEVGGTMTLSNATSGGTWTSANSYLASVGSSSGVVTGNAPGWVPISYTISNTCGTHTTTVQVTVSPASSVPAISGTSSVCAGSVITLTNTSAGGVWSTSNTSVATVSSGGSVTGIASGTAMITYTVGAGYATKTITVNALADAGTITGVASACAGAATTLSNSVSGGVWSSGNTSVATVGTTGLVSGVAAGNAIISYGVTNGCGTQYATRTVTVSTTPAAITGPLYYCKGSFATLASATAGGSWSTSNIAKAYVSPSTGVVTGLAVGTATISYVLGTGCFTTADVTVDAAVSAISGPARVCIGDEIALASADAGGTWSSSDTTKATVDISTGVVSGLVVGSPAITYKISDGCFAVRIVPVNLLPAPITGTATICTGSYTVLYSTLGGSGTWSSSDAGVATVNSISGMVTSVSAGTSTITYKVNSTGCYRTQEVTVNAAPAPIDGSSTVCLGASPVLTNATPGGIWSSNKTYVATIGSASGEVYGVTCGGATITYRLPGGCYVTKAVTVTPVPAAISGSLSMCAGGGVTLSSTTSGGTWSSASTSVATIGSATGVVTSVGTGTTLISYSNAAGCAATAILTVNSALPVNLGNDAICLGGTSLLTNTVAGGSWTSSNAAKAIVNAATGLVTGLSAGTANISYRVGATCVALTQVTVGSTPAPITGNAVVCVGASSMLSHINAGGAWSSSNTAKATVNATTGEVTGIAAGTVVITYMVSEGCFATKAITVKAPPSAIYGTLTVCEGQTTSLTGYSAETNWYSSDEDVATVNSVNGIVYGISTGTATITYRASSGCYTTAEVTVQSLPASIDGNTVVCAGSTATLSYGPGGGAWSSGNSGVASIGSASGIVAGVAGGTATITYRLSSGCRSTVVVTVGATLSAISGTSSICEGNSSMYSNSVAGGIWSSSGSHVSIDASGVAVATSAGTTIISYSRLGCLQTKEVTVNPSPAANVGTTFMCMGGTTTFTNLTAGGTWSSSHASKASVDAASGLVSANTPGTANISYTIANGCYAVSQVTVNVTLPGISGSFKVCEGQTTALSHEIPGGAWSSSNTGRATVDAATGVVTGVSAGAVKITYSTGAGCFAVLNMQVYSLPDAITGSSAVCEGGYMVLTGTVGGSGTWSSADAATADVNIHSGLVSGIAAGTTTISYKVNSTGCYVTRDITVLPAPATIAGAANICTGLPATYTSATGGGTWSSSNPSVAGVSAYGVVTGMTGGGVTLSYTNASGCSSTRALTVNPSPAAISGTAIVCIGNSVTLSTASVGGTWSSSSPSIASVGTTGQVSGLTAGTTEIRYTNSATGCYAALTATVNSGLAAISAPSAVCVGNSTTFTCATTGGTWSSSNTAVLPVFASSGYVVGVSAGTATISYRIGSGCVSTATVTVNGVMPSISGTAKACVGQTALFADALAGGAWSSSNTAIGSVDATSGVVTGISSGSFTLSYAAGAGCYATQLVFVYAQPANITGSASICDGSYTVLYSTIGGSGTWSSSNTSVAAVNSISGMVTSVSAGTSTITYRIPSTGCFVTRDVTVNVAPSAIGGTSAICAGNAEVMTNTVSGGTWTSSATGVATIGSSSGIFNAVSAGGVTVTYTLPSGCKATKAATVNGLPAVISGPGSVCIGASVTLSNLVGTGSWSCSNTGIASVISATGVVTGVAGGSATITYTLPSGCYRTHSIATTASRGAEPAEQPTADEIAPMSVYPNPAAGAFNIDVPMNGMLEIVSMDGKLVYVMQLVAGVSRVSLPADQASGMYICRFTDERGSTQMVKLVYNN